MASGVLPYLDIPSSLNFQLRTLLLLIVGDSGSVPRAMTVGRFSCRRVRSASELSLGRTLYLSGFGLGMGGLDRPFAEGMQVFEELRCSSIVWGGDDRRPDSFTAFIIHVLASLVRSGRPLPILLAYKFRGEEASLLSSWDGAAVELIADGTERILDLPLNYVLVDEGLIGANNENKYYQLAELIFELPWMVTVLSFGGGDTVLLEFGGICALLRRRPLIKLTWFVAPLPRSREGRRDECFLRRSLAPRSLIT